MPFEEKNISIGVVACFNMKIAESCSQCASTWDTNENRYCLCICKDSTQSCWVPLTKRGTRISGESRACIDCKHKKGTQRWCNSKSYINDGKSSFIINNKDVPMATPKDIQTIIQKIDNDGVNLAISEVKKRNGVIL